MVCQCVIKRRWRGSPARQLDHALSGKISENYGFPLLCINFQWCLSISTDFQWFSLVFDDFRWFLMTLADYCRSVGASSGPGKPRQWRLMSHCKFLYAHSALRGTCDGLGLPIHPLRVRSIIFRNLSKKVHKNLCFVYIKKRQDYMFCCQKLDLENTE